jgi:hypothetical protein
MQIIVRSDDGKREASVHIEPRGSDSEKVLLEFLLRLWIAFEIDEKVKSITVTDVPSEPEPDGFKFKVGDKVRGTNEFHEWHTDYVIGTVESRKLRHLTYECPLYTLDGGRRIAETWLEPAP